MRKVSQGKLKLRSAIGPRTASNLESFRVDGGGEFPPRSRIRQLRK